MKDNFEYDDGGRRAAGYRGYAGDCVVRACAIVTGLSYDTVYKGIEQANIKKSKTRARAGDTLRARGTAPSRGVLRSIYKPIFKELGLVEVNALKEGVYTTDGNLPKGKVICHIRRHLFAVVDGVIHDTWNPAKESQRIDRYYRLEE